MDEGLLDDLTSRYYDAEGDLFGDILQYIKRQPEAFYFNGVIYAPPPYPPVPRED